VSALLEERIQLREGTRPRIATGAARAVAGLEPIAAVRSLGVPYPLGAGLPALVVGAGIVELAVLADVQVGAAAVAGIAEADTLPLGQIDGRVAARTAHGCERVAFSQPCQARGSQAREGQAGDCRAGDSPRPRAGAGRGPSLLPLLLSLALLLPLAGVASAQQPSTISVNDLAVDWARGRFAGPVVCMFEDEPVRGMRRVTISAGPVHARPRVARVQFKDIEADDASRCFNDMGRAVSNIRGSVEIHLPSTRARDTALRDFKSEMRRNHGFEFVISSGGLQIQSIGADSKTQVVDFKGGTAGLFEVRPGSDTARILADFPSPRKVSLFLEAKDGTRLELPLFMTDFR